MIASFLKADLCASKSRENCFRTNVKVLLKNKVVFAEAENEIAR